VAGGAAILHAAGAAAARALDIELHTAAHLGDMASAVALRALHGRAGGGLAMAGRADFLPQDLQPRGATANRSPEIDVDCVFEVGAGLGAMRRLLAARLIEHAGEDVAETAPAATGSARSGLSLCSRAAFEVRKVEALEIEGNFLRSGTGTRATIAASRCRFGLRRIDLVGVEAELVVDLALFVVAQDVVGLGDLLELLFRLLVAGVHVRVIFARKFAEGLADLLRSGRLLDSENAVVVLVLC
jgi:hypothetical protein